MFITHRDIRQFAEESVDLPSQHARKYRGQIQDLCDRLDKRIKDNPDYRLKRMMTSGSLAKRTALRSVSDADVALYVKPSDAEAAEDWDEFLNWLAKELADIYGDIKGIIVEPNSKSCCICVRYTGNELDVDVVPIYWLNEKWDGEIVSKHDRSRVRTNIPQHLEFVKKRHQHHPNFRQVVRLLKFWASEQKEANSNFRFKSFMTELIAAHLLDKDQLNLDDYTQALREFFDYLLKSNLDEVISFSDFGHGAVRKQAKSINIFDPVNSKNNIAERYDARHKELILEAAMNAADAIEYAACATSKDIALRQWQKVFGDSFSV